MIVFSHLYTLLFFLFFFYSYGDHRDLHSFPTRRSSDLFREPYLQQHLLRGRRLEPIDHCRPRSFGDFDRLPANTGDRKSTRLNSSHQIISYAVFCLKKKKKKKTTSNPTKATLTPTITRK